MRFHDKHPSFVNTRNTTRHPSSSRRIYEPIVSKKLQRYAAMFRRGQFAVLFLYFRRKSILSRVYKILHDGAVRKRYRVSFFDLCQNTRTFYRNEASGCPRLKRSTRRTFGFVAVPRYSSRQKIHFVSYFIKSRGG